MRVFAGLLMLFPTVVHAQQSLPLIRSNASTITIRDGAVMKGWWLTPEAKPDVFEAELINGKPHRVTFITDIDSIAFVVEEGKRYDFIVQKGDTANYTQIVGTRMIPAVGVIAGQITAAVNPPRVCADERPDPYLNFDVILRNGSDNELQVKRLIALVTDTKGEVVERRVIGQQLVDFLGPGRVVGPLTDALIFNPFRFNSVRPGMSIRYQFEFASPSTQPVSVSVTPESCVTRARLSVPLKGRVAVFDGHDVLSHHRRSGYIGRGAKAFGIVDNVGRFGLDLVLVDKDANEHRGDGKRNEDYFSWGQPVRAAGSGVVVGMHNDQPDNTIIGTEHLWTNRDLSKNEMSPSGNYVLIDHGTGEFSLAAHLRAGSVRVKKGDRVKAGDLIGEIGNSGSSTGPHLHYELRSGWGVKGVRSLPAYFRDLKVLGTGESGSKKGVMLNTGDVLLAD